MSKSQTSYQIRRRWRVEHARAALSALEESGLSVSAFARREGFNPKRLHAWRKRLGAGSARKIAARVPAFVELRARHARVAEPLEVALPSGHVVRVPTSFDADSLRRVLDVLAQASTC